MSTLMQKDVLIEAVANAKAISINKHQGKHPASKRLGQLRNIIYLSSPQQIDFNEILQEINLLKETLLSLPDLSLHNELTGDMLILSKFEEAWKQMLEDNPQIKKSDNLKAFLLGGQPGAGKSFGAKQALHQLNNNIVVINGDEFRALHPEYEEIYKQHGKDASKYTGEFAGIMVHLFRERALKEKLNIVIEGTFRTTETPIRELTNFKKHGYSVDLIICTCPQEVSLDSTFERAEGHKKIGIQPRYVPPEHHDLVVDKLPQNVSEVFNTGLVDKLEIYSREGKCFDSTTNNPDEIAQRIYQILHATDSY
ncbi:zeta toxin family protein [Actinobacillus delphinicola]|uniref:UDP-N-acetylglucosamine kinase n=1 Tax=Actinobacillus delphinicola TaxID=51161 RepID=A0A448TVW1_9PAST|nr:zeta toxin family protein [Actinobacillus delphinicola]VEJ10064.1 UDP-N-acetylglucosamine kinase [Actinobacillus delphinicola]